MLKCNKHNTSYTHTTNAHTVGEIYTYKLSYASRGGFASLRKTVTQININS